MTKEQIADMAREARVFASHKTGDSNEWHEIRDQHFALLIASAERERCAQMVEKLGGASHAWYAEFIRARGQQ